MYIELSEAKEACKPKSRKSLDLCFLLSTLRRSAYCTRPNRGIVPVYCLVCVSRAVLVYITQRKKLDHRFGMRSATLSQRRKHELKRVCVCVLRVVDPEMRCLPTNVLCGITAHRKATDQEKPADPGIPPSCDVQGPFTLSFGSSHHSASSRHITTFSAHHRTHTFPTPQRRSTIFIASTSDTVVSRHVRGAHHFSFAGGQAHSHSRPQVTNKAQRCGFHLDHHSLQFSLILFRHYSLAILCLLPRS